MAEGLQGKVNWSGFSKLTQKERYRFLIEQGFLENKEAEFLENGGIKDFRLAEHFVENVIGYFQLPLGVATCFVIDGKEVPIPMAVEETSIIAAASKSAKWVRESGGVITETLGNSIIGQIQLATVKNFENFKHVVEAASASLISEVNQVVASGLVARGGGVQRLEVRKIERPDRQTMAVIHVYADTCDAMGANIINQVCEYLKTPIEILTGESVTMCILSNLVDSKLTRAIVEIPDIDRRYGQGLGKKIEEASLFAQLDPYRAATNNKGVLNGIDPILIATGNDWRAVEAGVHAYSVKDGRYSSVTRWWMDEDTLVGEFLEPIAVGTVGGVTQLHPVAKMALKMMQIEHAADLSRICAAVGLVQNLGALRALSTVGIIEGHMKLHIRNLSLGAGASEPEMPLLQKKLEDLLKLTKRITLQNAVEALGEIRKSTTPSIQPRH